MKEKLPKPALVDDGYCFGCGPENPIGLKLEFGWDEGGDYVTQYTPAREHQGWAGRIHGGFVSLVFDEVLSRVVLEQKGREWVTAEFTTRLLRPILVGMPLFFRARITAARSRLCLSEGEAYTADGILVATGLAKLMPIKG